MKLAIIITALTPYRITLYEELCRFATKVTVLSMMHHSKEMREWDLTQYSPNFIHKILPGVTIPRSRWPFPVSVNYGVIPVLWRIKPDVVISTGGFSLANVGSFIYCKIFGKKFVNWCEFTLEDGSRRSAVKRFIRRTLSRHADGSIASSSDSKDAFVRFGADPEKVRVIVMPVDVETFHESASEFRVLPKYTSLRKQYPGTLIIVVGRLDEIKGYPELFRIYERLVALRPDVGLLIVGSGPQRKEYETLVHKKGWKNVHFLGFLEPPTLAQYMALSDFSVFPTLNDSFGAVIAEAMAAELPVIASIFAYATRDLVDDGVTGYRFNPRDTDEAVKITLRLVDMNDIERKEMGQRAYNKVRDYDCENAARRTAEFLQQIINLKD
ncbi:MAG: glycosyltransferase family 4 protein [Burkholderiales bacterium]